MGLVLVTGLAQGIPIDVPRPSQRPQTSASSGTSTSQNDVSTTLRGTPTSQNDVKPPDEHPNPSVMSPPPAATTTNGVTTTPPQTKTQPPVTNKYDYEPIAPANNGPQNTNPPTKHEPTPRSPTPPGFPFGAPTGSYAPAGGGVSGPVPGFKSTEGQ